MIDSSGFFLALFIAFSVSASIFTAINVYLTNNQLKEEISGVQDNLSKVKDMLNYTITVSFLNKVPGNSSYNN